MRENRMDELMNTIKHIFPPPDPIIMNQFLFYKDYGIISS
jgi:hypothetical protein